MFRKVCELKLFPVNLIGINLTTTTMQEPKSPEQEPGGPASATRVRPLFSTRTSTLFPSVFSPFSSYFSPFHSSILHSLHVLFSFFFPIFLLLLLFTPHF